MLVPLLALVLALPIAARAAAVDPPAETTPDAGAVESPKPDQTPDQKPDQTPGQAPDQVPGQEPAPAQSAPPAGQATATPPASPAPEAGTAPTSATPDETPSLDLGQVPGAPPAAAAAAPGTPPPAAAPGTPPAGAAPAAPAAAAPPPNPNRINFELPFPAERGGGKATGSADTMELKQDDYARLEGSVEILYKDMKLTADTARVDLKTKVVTAEGHVVLDQGPRRIGGTTATFDLETKTGKLTDASAFVSPDYYFTGKELEKTGDDTYTITDGVFTSCDQPTPDWSFKVHRANVRVEGYARIHSASMRVKKVPFFYTPYLLWPVKRERAAGLLVPEPGYSNRLGASLSLAYFQPFGQSWDTTVYTDLYAKNYLGIGDELRYAPTDGTNGRFVGYAIRDPLLDRWRWKLSLDHETRDLPGGMRGVISYRDFSDFDFLRDFERDFNRTSIRSLYSRGFVSGSWGAQSLNLLVDDRQTLISGNQTVTQRRLPEVEYRLRQTRLGRLPLYLDVDSSADYFQVDRATSYSGNYGRADLLPTLTLPIRTVPWLSLSLSAGDRVTWYSDSLCVVDPLHAGQAGVCPTSTVAFTGQSESRNVETAGAEIVGPSFSRIFSRSPTSAKLKHVIEPRFTYTYLSSIDPQERSRFPLFDEVDTLRSTNTGHFALVNRLLAKPAGGEGSALQVLALEIGQDVSFDSQQPLQVSGDGKTTSQRGPLTATLRFTPSPATNVQAQATYGTLFSRLTSTSFSGSYGMGPTNVGLTWFTRFDQKSGETLGNQLRFSGGVDVIRQKLRLETQLNYDANLSQLQQQRWVLTYTGQCWGIRLEVHDLTVLNTKETDYRIAISLKNVGTFLDLTGGSGTGASTSNF